MAPLLVSDGSAAIYGFLMHANSAWSTLSTILSLWLIVCNTPKTMGSYKWFLLNVSICSYLFDMFVTIFYVPFTMFPVVGTCALGLMGMLDPFWGTVVAWGLHNLLLGVCGMSIISAAFYRLAAVTNRLELMTSKPMIAVLALCHLLLALPSYIVHFALVDDTDAKRDYVINNFPEVAPFYTSHTCTMYSLGNTRLYIYAAVATTNVAACLVLCQVILSMAFKTLNRVKSTLSVRTYQLQRSLTQSLVYQFILPNVLITLPYVFFGIDALVLPPFAQHVSFVTFILSTFHTTANTIIMVVFVKPYRDAVKYKLLRRPKMSVAVSAAEQTVSRSGLSSVRQTFIRTRRSHSYN